MKEDKQAQIEKFKNEVLETYKEKRGSLIQLLKKHNKYTTPDISLKKSSDNEGSHIGETFTISHHHPQDSHHIVDELTRKEEKEIYRSLKENIEKKLTFSRERYKEAFKHIGAEDIGDYVILIDYPEMDETLLKDSGAAWGPSPPPCEIYGEKVPVINPLCDSETQGTMILLNTKTLPTWVQYANPKSENEPDELHIDVYALPENKTSFDKPLEDLPRLLKKEGNKELLQSYIKGEMIVKVYEKSNLEFTDDSLEGSILVTFEGDP